jgi:Tfp pilus assembly protein PilF
MLVKLKSMILGALIATTLSCAAYLPQASAETSYEDKQRAYDLGVAGAAQLDVNNNQKAAELLWQASKIDPSSFATQYNLGIAFSKLKRWPDAWQAYSKALRLRPADGEAWLAVAEAYYECGDKQRAINMVKDVQQRFKTNRAVMDRAAELAVYFAQDD